MKTDKKQKVEVRVNADTGRLYGTIDNAILYLAEIRDQYQGIDISLDEHWTGYEDMEMTFVYDREETDEEFEARLAQEARARKWAEEQKRDAERRAKDEKEFKRLAAKLGRRLNY